jgi:hypothetical protein
MQKELSILEKHQKGFARSFVFSFPVSTLLSCTLYPDLSNLWDLYVPTFGIWQNFDFYFQMNGILCKIILILLPYIEVLVYLWMIRTVKLNLTSNGPVLRTIGGTIKTSWGNVVRVKSSSMFGGYQYEFVLNAPAEVEGSNWMARLRGAAVKRIPFSLFIDLRSGDGFALLEQYIPQVVAEWRRDYVSGGKDMERRKTYLTRIVLITVLVLFITLGCIIGFLHRW